MLYLLGCQLRLSVPSYTGGDQGVFWAPWEPFSDGLEIIAWEISSDYASAPKKLLIPSQNEGNYLLVRPLYCEGATDGKALSSTR